MQEQSEPVASTPVDAHAVVDEVALEPRTDHIIGMSFDKTSRAEEVLLNLAHLAKEGELLLTDAVVVYKDDRERVHVRQTIDTTPTQGALSGSLWGVLVGTLFGGPVGAIIGAGAGAASGGLLGKLVDVGLDDDWVKQVGDWIDPGSSALLVLVADDVRPVVVRELSRFEGTVLYCTFPDAVRHELERALGSSPTDRADSGDPTSTVIVDEPAL